MARTGSQDRGRKVRVLGVDPAASGPTGYAVVETDGRMARPLCFGALRHSARSSFPSRLRAVYRLIASLLERFSPDAIAVESVFGAPNVRTSLKLAEVRGVVLLAGAQASIAVHSYSPREVKAGIVGYGAANKEQIQRMVGALLRLSEPPESSDAADALAVALCHIFAAQAGARISAATGGVVAPRAAGPGGLATRNGLPGRKPGAAQTSARAARIESLR